MSRLYEIKCNEEQWIVKGTRDVGYKIVNKETFDSHSISGDIIGIEQITDDEFLVYRRIMRDKWQILRVKLQNAATILEYHPDTKCPLYLQEL